MSASLRQRLSGWLPFLVIGSIFLWSVYEVHTRRLEVVFDGRTTIRIGHYQLEPGVREGLAKAGAAYEKLHPEIRVIQEAIPEGTYGQWLSTQLMGGTAPDIVQMGMLFDNQLTAFYTRYMVPLTPEISRPNPYNKGTELEGVPLIRTFKDGMRRSYINELQEYMNMPLGLASMRLFYNKTLLEKLTGKKEAPEDFRGFLKTCEEIQKKKQANGRPYIPIAGSSYHFNGWMANLIMPLTYRAFYRTDFNEDGLFSREEMFLGFLSGKLSFSLPAYRDSFRMVPEISRFFPDGWVGLNRDEAVFAFAQQRSVFISTGIWEAQALAQQAEGHFKIGIIDFPMPAPSDPVYGKIVSGARYENPEGGMPMAITNNSKHPEVALDFLLFLASQKQNEIFNEHLKWIPIIKGAKPAEGLEIFEPRLEGVSPAFDASMGSESVIRWGQTYSLFKIGQLSYETMGADFAHFYTTAGVADFREFLRNIVRSQTQRAQFAVGLRAKALADNTPLSWIKYRMAVDAMLVAEASALQKNYLLENPGKLKDMPLFEYSPEAMKRITQSVKGNGL